MDLAIIPECYVDTNLTETLVPPQSRGYNHQKGCGTVTKVMKEKFHDSFAIGIIDKDKNEVKYLEECDIIMKSGSLYLHKHKHRHHYLIQISPIIERMILNNAAACGINVKDYGLPSELEEFKKESKTETSKKDKRFKSLFKALKQAKAPDFEKLESWIKYLKDKTYTADMTDIKNL